MSSAPKILLIAVLCAVAVDAYKSVKEVKHGSEDERMAQHMMLNQHRRSGYQKRDPHPRDLSHHESQEAQSGKLLHAVSPAYHFKVGPHYPGSINRNGHLPPLRRNSKGHVIAPGIRDDTMHGLHVH
jgi:hypothetical protein